MYFILYSKGQQGKIIIEGRDNVKKRKITLFSCIFSIIFSFSSVSAEKLLVPSGKSIGVILSTNGVMVVNVCEIETQNSGNVSPAKEAGIKSGDFIRSVDGCNISNVSELNEKISASKGEPVPITVMRKGKTVQTLISPQLAKSDGEWRIGAWVKDAASGIGTMTYFDPSDSSFAALGHGICDAETGEVIDVDGGNILNSTIVSVNKGEKGVPGELKGVFSENKNVIGEIEKNNQSGIYGKTTEIQQGDAISVAEKSEVQEGKAQILANVEGNIVEEFDIEIVRLMPLSMATQKGIVLKVTDEKLIEKTGGIVQGMSGSPIIQNGKLVGAVTHVFVNDPTRGYGIFIENMLAEEENIE